MQFLHSVGDGVGSCDPPAVMENSFHRLNSKSVRKTFVTAVSSLTGLAPSQGKPRHPALAQAMIEQRNRGFQQGSYGDSKMVYSQLAKLTWIVTPNLNNANNSFDEFSILGWKSRISKFIQFLYVVEPTFIVGLCENSKHVTLNKTKKYITSKHNKCNAANLYTINPFKKSRHPNQLLTRGTRANCLRI